MKNYIKERLGELHNVTWPTKKQATHSMILVMIIMIITGIFLSNIDYLLNQVVLQIVK